MVDVHMFACVYSCRYSGGATEVEEMFWGDIQTRAEGWGVSGKGTARVWQCSSYQCQGSLQVPASGAYVILRHTMYFYTHSHRSYNYVYVCIHVQLCS